MLLPKIKSCHPLPPRTSPQSRDYYYSMPIPRLPRPRLRPNGSSTPTHQPQRTAQNITDIKPPTLHARYRNRKQGSRMSLPLPRCPYSSDASEPCIARVSPILAPTSCPHAQANIALYCTYSYNVGHGQPLSHPGRYPKRPSAHARAGQEIYDKR